MKAGVAELKASLSRYLARVKAGQEVLVTDHGRPVAKLVPVAEAEAGSRRASLIRDGLLLPGRGRIRPSLLRRPPRGPGASVLDALLEERREGR
jgi:prevent-host-death family protein